MRKSIRLSKQYLSLLYRPIKSIMYPPCSCAGAQKCIIIIALRLCLLRCVAQIANNFRFYLSKRYALCA